MLAEVHRLVHLCVIKTLSIKHIAIKRCTAQCTF
jgi:hypothetical protein